MSARKVVAFSSVGFPFFRCPPVFSPLAFLLPFHFRILALKGNLNQMLLKTWNKLNWSCIDSTVNQI